MAIRRVIYGILATMFLFCVVGMIGLSALAETAIAPVGDWIGEVAERADEAYGWPTLATTAGASAAVLLIVQYIKAGLDRVWKIPTRLLVYVLCLAILACARAVMFGLTWADAPLLAINSFVAALTAMGAYELTFAKGEKL